MARYHYSKSTDDQRQFVSIPITRENGTSIRTVPITFINETTKTNPNKPTLINLLRPNAKYFREETSTTLPRLNSVSHRLSLTLPAESQKVPQVSSISVPIRFPLMTSPRISSAFVQGQKSDMNENSPSITTVNVNTNNSLAIRRAEVMAREAIQSLVRLQHQQRNETLRSPVDQRRSSGLSRRVIINLPNNQSVSLDNRLSSTMKPPKSQSRSSTTKNNLFYIPVLHECQVNAPKSTTNDDKIHIEIPVTIDDETQQQQRRHSMSSSTTSTSNPTLKSILKRSSSRDTMASRKSVSFTNI